jgi:hypothetical protein
VPVALRLNVPGSGMEPAASHPGSKLEQDGISVICPTVTVPSSSGDVEMFRTV